MKISLNWLKDYIGLDQSAEQLEEALTLIGCEVEGVEEIGIPQMDHVVVGEVLEKTPHPDADRLNVCKVKVAGDEEPRQIVCGATNYKIGDRVPVALPGAVLPGGFKIKSSKLRGVPSEGMMCSAKELGLGDDHAGLLILADKPEIGLGINEVYKENDTVFEISITPNRPDCLSHIGIARELAAYFDLNVCYPEIQCGSGQGEGGSNALISQVRVDEPECCPHYRAYSITGVKVGPSPQWLSSRLKAIGLRPINNVVDVTNYVLHELGQPLHAFDANKIEGGEIIVRHARAGEKITTLDEKERELTNSNLVIADKERALVVAGIMGSIAAEVDESTTDIVLESAYFNPTSVRLTARRLGLSSDSSYRFERGVDPKGAEFAALRAIDLILEVAGGKLTGTPQINGEPPKIEREIEVTPSYVRERIGFEVEDKTIENILSRLEMNVREYTDDAGNALWQVGIPSYRVDLDRPIDLVEEFLRIYGTDKVPETSVISAGLSREDDPLIEYDRKVANYLAAIGFNECVNYTLREKEELGKWFPHASAGSLNLANPLTSEQTHLRPSLLPGLLDVLQYNGNQGNKPLALFETGHVFREHEGQIHELVSVGFVLVQSPRPETWRQREEPDFYTAVRIAKDILTLAGAKVERMWVEALDNSDPWQKGHAARIGNYLNGFEAKMGLLNAHFLKDWDIDGVVLAGSIYLTPDYLRKPRKRARFAPYSSFPASSRDIALLVDKELTAGKVQADLERVAKKAAGKEINLENVEVFDVYEGKGMPEGKKSLAFTLDFRSSTGTLSDEQISKVFETICQQITGKTGYTLR